MSKLDAVARWLLREQTKWFVLVIAVYILDELSGNDVWFATGFPIGMLFVALNLWRRARRERGDDGLDDSTN